MALLDASMIREMEDVADEYSDWENARRKLAVAAVKATIAKENQERGRIIACLKQKPG